MINMSLNIEKILEEELSNNQVKPFSSNYTPSLLISDSKIPQISLENKKVCVHCKVTEDFATMHQYSFDEETLPPKVLCWTDLSTLDINMAKKTVNTCIKNAYKYIIEEAEISTMPVSRGNREPLSHIIPSILDNNVQIIYHILDPNLNQKSGSIQLPSQQHKLKLSRGGHFKSLSGETLSNTNTQAIHYPGIQDDEVGLKSVAEQVPNGTIFILDCSFATKVREILENDKDFIILYATSGSLLYDPQLPCDLFTSCLLSPAKVALLWQSRNYSDIHSELLSEINIQTLIDLISDSPVAFEVLNLLEDALQAYVDKIAYEMLRENNLLDLFYNIFRHDSLRSRLFSNFLFAVRIMKTLSISPESYPVLPDLSDHDLWDSFYLQVDRALFSIKESIKPSPSRPTMFSYSDFLSENITRLENWLAFPEKSRSVPYELHSLMLLLKSEKYRIKAVELCSKFLMISSKCICAFLNTRSFPLIIELLQDQLFLESVDPSTLSHLALIAVKCFTYVPSLVDLYDFDISFWLKKVNDDNILVKRASLYCLLLFANDKNIRLYNEQGLENIILDLILLEDVKIRALSHLILGKMRNGIISPNEIKKEKCPLSRAALAYRLSTSMSKLDNIDDEAVRSLVYETILLLDDPYILVREESIVAISHYIKNESGKFIEALKNFLIDCSGYDPLATSIGEYLISLQFEPSDRVNKKLEEFLIFLSDKFCKRETKGLLSETSNVILYKVSQDYVQTTTSRSFFKSTKMDVIDSALIGSPQISPSGFMSCGDDRGRLYYQSSDNNIQKMELFQPCFSSKNYISNEFDMILSKRFETNQIVEYNTFIDDSRILSVSDRSQVVLFNIEHNETESAFLMTAPLYCKHTICDYNHRTSQILHSIGKGYVDTFDIQSQLGVTGLSLSEDSRITRLEWLNPYRNLFLVASDDIILYDIRDPKSYIAKFEGSGSNLVSCNCTSVHPFNLVSGYRNRKVSAIDLRTMEFIFNERLNSSLTHFEMHRHLPIAIGLTEYLTLFNFEGGKVATEIIQTDTLPDSFSLHHSDACCVLRYGNSIRPMDITY